MKIPVNPYEIGIRGNSGSNQEVEFMKKLIVLGMLATLALLTTTTCTYELNGVDMSFGMNEDLSEEFQYNYTGSHKNSNEERDTLYRFEQDGLWGFRDAYDNIIIEPQYFFAYEFSEGLAPIRGIPSAEDVWGFIDLTGNLVISLPSIVSISKGFSEGFAVIVEREWDWDNEDPLAVDTIGPFVFIDRLGNNTFGLEFENVLPFRDGLARVVLINGNATFIDKTGANAFNMEFIDLRGFDEDGYAMVTLLDGTRTHMDRSGNIVDKGDGQ